MMPCASVEAHGVDRYTVGTCSPLLGFIAAPYSDAIADEVPDDTNSPQRDEHAAPFCQVQPHHADTVPAKSRAMTPATASTFDTRRAGTRSRWSLVTAFTTSPPVRGYGSEVEPAPMRHA